MCNETRYPLEGQGRAGRWVRFQLFCLPEPTCSARTDDPKEGLCEPL